MKKKKVYSDLGAGVLSNAWNGYNASLFAYGKHSFKKKNFFFSLQISLKFILKDKLVQAKAIRLSVTVPTKELCH